MKTYFVTMSRGSLIRNFFRSGVVPGLLKSGHKVVLLTPLNDKPEYFKEWASERLILEPLITQGKQPLIRLLVNELAKAAVFNDTVRTLYTYTIATDRDPSKILYFPRMYVLPSLRFIPGFKAFVRFLALRLDPQKSHDYLFEKYKPDAVFSTTLHDDPDVAVLKSGARFGAKLYGMPKSWDNLSKILFPVQLRNILVWGELMKEQAIRLQGYRPNDVVVTGVPQFDYYAHASHVEERMTFFKRHGLDPNKKLILYGSSGADMCDEALFCDLLKKYMDTHPDVQVLIRPHIGYEGDAERFMRFKNAPGFVIDTTEKQDTSLRDNWDTSEYHLKNLFNSLHHADVCVNVASTLTLDSLVVGVPVVNLYFDPDPSVDPKRRSVKRLFKAGYIKSIVESRASHIAASEDDLYRGIDEALANRSIRAREREVAVRDFAKNTEGKAAERIVAALTQE